MAANHSNREIAEELFVAVSTVKTHVNHILSKLEQPNRIGAVLEYQRLTKMLSEQPSQVGFDGHLHPSDNAESTPGMIP